MATKQFSTIKIEGVLFIARWVVGGSVEGIKIIKDGFDVGSISNSKAQGLENRGDPFGDLCDGMARSEGMPLPRLCRSNCAAVVAERVCCCFSLICSVSSFLNSLTALPNRGFSSAGTFFSSAIRSGSRPLRERYSMRTASISSAVCASWAACRATTLI